MGSDLEWEDMTRTHLVDVGQDTTTGNSGSDKLVELFVTTNGKLQVSRSDSLYSEILGGVTWPFSRRTHARLKE
jgi:hypothetical protein